MIVTDALFLRDAYIHKFSAKVVDRRDDTIVLDRTAFYPTGGGQPHDVGELRSLSQDEDRPSLRVIDVQKDGARIVHHVATDQDGAAEVLDAFAVGADVNGCVDWDRRHQLMRTHTVLHILCGVIWNEWSVPVTGGNMEPLSARMDFEFDPLPHDFVERVTELVNQEIRADRPIQVSFLPRDVAIDDAALIRTKVNLVPQTVGEIRVVDIVGLDKQADGGTHLSSTGDCGVFSIIKTESKGKGNKRVRIALSDA